MVRSREAGSRCAGWVVRHSTVRRRHHGADNDGVELPAVLVGHGALVLLAVGLAAGGAVAGHAARAPQDRATWVATAAALLLLSGSGLGRLGAGTPIGPWWALVAHLLGYALLFDAQMRLLSQRLHTWLPGAVLDILGGLAVACAIGWALLLGPLHEVSGSSTGQSVGLVLRASTGLLILAFSVTALLFGRRNRETRSWLMAAVVALVAAADAAAVHAVLARGAADSIASVAVGLLAPLLLVAASRGVAPGPDERRDEGSHVLLAAPVAYMVVCGVVLGWAHFSALPTPAVLAALTGLALVATKVVLVFGRITALNTSQRQAVTDELTGLGNRRALGSALAPVDDGATASLVLIDLDGFKGVNDALGHAAGDHLLQLVAQRLRSGVRDSEQVARQGGDEFALVLPGVDAGAAAARARLLVASLCEPYDLGGRAVVVAASAGVAAAPEHGRSAEDLLRRADAAMYAAKASGCGVVVHEPDAHAPDVRQERHARALH